MMFGFVPDVLLPATKMCFTVHVPAIVWFLAAHFLMIHELLIIVGRILTPLRMTNVLLIRVMRAFSYDTKIFENLVTPRMGTLVDPRLMAQVHFRLQCSQWWWACPPWCLFRRQTGHQLLLQAAGALQCFTDRFWNNLP